LADASFIGTDVYGVRYTLETLIAVLLRLILQRIEAELGQPVTSLVVGRPVHYAINPRHDALAIERMRQACELAGLPSVTFLPEPTAAAFAYARAVRGEQHLLVFDFGGGTLDITIMRVDEQGRRVVLATEGVPVGGDLLDRRIVLGKLLPHFGAEARLGPRRLPFPVAIPAHLGEWQSIMELNQPRWMTIIDEAVRTGDRPVELRALRTLVRENYGLPLYEAVERAKVRLSDEPAVAIAMNVPDIRFVERLQRWDFEQLIDEDLAAVSACVERAVTAAGLTPAAIDVVLRTGGSSRIPAFVRLLSARFGAEKVQEMDAFTGVASGLAIVASEVALQERLREAGVLTV
jgi:hypothetical chaperone protein